MSLTKPTGAALALLVAVTGCTSTQFSPRSAVSAAVRQESGQVVVPLSGGTARVEPETMRVTARTADGQELLLSSPAAGLGTASPPVVTKGEASWEFPEKALTVRAGSRDGRLVVSVSGGNGSLTWPVTGTDPATTSLQVPSGEGLSIPVADPWWNSPQAKLGELQVGGGDLTMAFWGVSAGKHGAAYITPTDIGTTLTLKSAQGRLGATAGHDFTKARDYQVEFALTGDSPVAQAADYRRWLVRRGMFTSLKQKIEANPEVGKLGGAVHAYLWGDARTARSVGRLRAAGVGRMWLGYDADGHPMKADAVKAAEQAGYLVGPYDSWYNAQDPKTADTSVAKWPGTLWPKGCVHDAKGRPETGFAGRGCYLSSQALPRDVIAKRVDEMTANGATSYFLDVDAAGELFDDHSPGHRMTAEQDRKNRVERMRYLSKDRKLVLGSEAARGWASQVLAFSHGSATPSLQFLWPLRKNRQSWGAYWPPTAPGIFFKPVDLPADATKAMYDPRYRVPLYQTVLHDSVINLDRWDLDYYKLANLKRERTLLSMLYGTPLNFVLDGPGVEQHAAEIAKLQKAFARIHEAAATVPMTGFAYLTADRLVQRSTFGDLNVTANFGTRAHNGLGAGCVSWAEGNARPQSQCFS